MRAVFSICHFQFMSNDRFERMRKCKQPNAKSDSNANTNSYASRGYPHANAHCYSNA
jgi:hypothetical protein